MIHYKYAVCDMLRSKFGIEDILLLKSWKIFSL